MLSIEQTAVTSASLRESQSLYYGGFVDVAMSFDGNTQTLLCEDQNRYAQVGTKRGQRNEERKGSERFLMKKN